MIAMLASNQPTAYAGIVARRTPPDVLTLMRQLAAALAGEGAVLRTGGAGGADQAFEAGAEIASGAIELFLPWPGFQERRGALLERPSAAAHELARRYHPAWHRLSRGARALQARNSHQVLGADLASPVGRVVCWTPDGSLDGRGPRSGGTGQALRVAAAHGIAVRNLARPEHRAAALRLIAELS